MIGSSADGRPVRFFFMLCIGWTGMRLFGTIASTAPLPATVPPAPRRSDRLPHPSGAHDPDHPQNRDGNIGWQ